MTVGYSKVIFNNCVYNQDSDCPSSKSRGQMITFYIKICGERGFEHPLPETRSSPKDPVCESTIYVLEKK